MVGRAGGGVRARLVPAVAASALALVALLDLAGAGTLTVTQCVPGGGLARFGLGLALLRVDEACPHGSFAVGGDQRQVIGVAVVVAIPVVVAHLVGASVGVGALARLARLVRVLVAVLDVGRFRLSAAPRCPEPARLAVDVAVDRPASRVPVGGPRWRGPPRLRFA